MSETKVTFEEIHRDNNGVYVTHTVGHESFPAGHHYHIGVIDNGISKGLGMVIFQNGGVATNGVNGLTNEALLAIVAHRMKILNVEFPCIENEKAIECTEAALAALEARTAARQARGVEGQEKA